MLYLETYAKDMKRFVYLLFFALLFSIYSCDSNNSKNNGGVEITFETTAGNIKLFLFEETPLHKKQFTEMVDSKFYNDILFHRVIKDFVIQAGDPTTKNPEPDKIYGEASGGTLTKAEFIPQFKHIRGALGAARESDAVNPQKLSSGSHFYIVLGGPEVSDKEIYETEQRLGYKLDSKIVDNYKKHGGAPHLDGDYTIFGYVTEGMDIVDKIATVPVDKNHRPKNDIKIISSSSRQLTPEETAEKLNNYAQ